MTTGCPARGAGSPSVSAKAVQLAVAAGCQGRVGRGVSVRERATELREEGTSAKTFPTPGAPLPVESDTCRIVREVTVAAGRFAPGHLGELTQIVPFEMVDAALAETGSVQQRIRDLPSRVVVYLLLAGALFAGCGYRQGWAHLTAGLDGLPVARPRPAGGAPPPPPGGAPPPAAPFAPLPRPAPRPPPPRG